MNSLQVKGVIIREVPVGEADKILTILTKEYGMMTVSAKHARRPKNNMLFSTSALVFGEFELFGSESTRYYVNQVTIIESFNNLREDVVMLTYCAHIMDVVLDAMRDSSSSEDVYTLLIYTLYTLCKPNRDADLIVHTFELKLLFMIGYQPDLTACVLCHKPIQNEPFPTILFSHSHCGVICHDNACISKAKESVVLSASTFHCMQYIAGSSIEKVYSFNLDPKYVPELCLLATRYLCDRLERCYTKLRMLKEF